MARSDIKHRLGPYRDPEIDPAVFAATRRLLIERGYRGTSIDAIADAAGVSRPTIYRRWPSKAHVVYDAVYPASAPHVEPSAEPFPEITGAIAGILAFMSQPEAREAFPGLLADMRSDPELKSKLGERHSVGVSAAFKSLVERNAETLRQVDAGTLLDVVSGAAIHAMCIRDVSDLDAYIDSLTDLLLYGILKR
ncbi:MULTISPECIES: TetR/AcrR family transcriptional regulator [Mycobacteriaceae]|uniref:TetR family transcriptional regulator n=2 Tax=Mycobacteriaceae TaxID=1762 RepID=F5YUH9_MYCSD|nr:MULTISPECIES: TetR/AcrR family transcriptional regulator [Mycobacteriaceae]AEF35042.1 TetR family transcriptional regulator [Mycolicibacter sinensis]BBX11713.1 TetR family transcriptional regulator [Mycobacterium novum]